MPKRKDNSSAAKIAAAKVAEAEKIKKEQQKIIIGPHNGNVRIDPAHWESQYFNSEDQHYFDVNGEESEGEQGAEEEEEEREETYMHAPLSSSSATSQLQSAVTPRVTTSTTSTQTHLNSNTSTKVSGESKKQQTRRKPSQTKVSTTNLSDSGKLEKFVSAIRKKDITKVRKMLNKAGGAGGRLYLLNTPLSSTSILASQYEGMTAIAIAAIRDDCELFKALIIPSIIGVKNLQTALNTKLTYGTYKGLTVFAVIIQHGNNNILKEALQRLYQPGVILKLATANLSDAYAGLTPFTLAEKNNNEGAVEMLQKRDSRLVRSQKIQPASSSSSSSSEAKKSDQPKERTQGQKREREGEKEHLSSGKNKTRHAVSTSSSRDVLDQLMDDEEENHGEDIENISDEQLARFIHAAATNDIPNLNCLLNAAPNKDRRFQLIASYLEEGEYPNKSALHVAILKNHKSAIDAIFKSIPDMARETFEDLDKDMDWEEELPEDSPSFILIEHFRNVSSYKIYQPNSTTPSSPSRSAPPREHISKPIVRNPIAPAEQSLFTPGFFGSFSNLRPESVTLPSMSQSSVGQITPATINILDRPTTSIYKGKKS